jgi:hypothetical protein
MEISAVNATGRNLRNLLVYRGLVRRVACIGVARGDKLTCMTMQNFLWTVRHAAVGACVAMLWACASGPAPTPRTAVDSANLVRLIYKDDSAQGGDKVLMEFREIERTKAGSVAQVSAETGGPVTSSLFTMRGVCAITRSRGEKFFTTTRIASSPSRYSIVFPQSQSTTPEKDSSTGRIISLDECQLMGM